MPSPLSFARREIQPHYPALRALWQINKYLWMTLGFLLVYIPIARAQGMIRVPIAQVWLLFTLALADGGARTLLAWRRGGFLSDATAWLFTTLDIVLVSLAIHLTGGLGSDLWLVYFVVMIFELMFATPHQKRLITAGLSFAYLCATLPTQMAAVSPALPLSAYLRVLGSRLFFLHLVGSLSRRISLNALERDRQFSVLHEQMATTEERARIAREIHDGLGHSLVSVILRLELCQRLLHRAPEESEALLREEIASLRSAWNESRDLAFHLTPWDAQGAGESLADTLRRHLSRFAERTGIPAKLTAVEPLGTLSAEAVFGLTRIVQEALTNIARHANATQITVDLTTLSPEVGLFKCTITDNGSGFDVETQSVGIGLQSMRQRAEALGGHLSLFSVPGEGTRVEALLPIADS